MESSVSPPLDIIPNEFILFYYPISFIKVGPSLPKERAAENGRRQLINDPSTFQVDLPLSDSIKMDL